MNVEAIVDKLGDLNLIRPFKVRGNWYQCYCPFHNDGQERRPSFGVLLHQEYRNGVEYPEGFSHCFTCGHNGTLLETVTRLLKSRSITTGASEWLKDNIPGFETDSEFEHLLPDGLMIQLNSQYAIQSIKQRQGKNTTYVSEDELASYRYVVPYMYERKLTDDIIERYDIGFDANWIPPGRVNKVPCITIPVRDRNGNVLFIARRSVQGKLFNYPEGVMKPLYGADMIPAGTKSVVVCESVFNTLTAVRYGYSSVALLGTGNSQQVKELKQLGVREFVLAFDGDDAGRRAAERLKRQLKDVGMVWIVDMPDGKDVNDLTQAEFKEVYDARH